MYNENLVAAAGGMQRGLGRVVAPEAGPLAGAVSRTTSLIERLSGQLQRLDHLLTGLNGATPRDTPAVAGNGKIPSAPSVIDSLHSNLTALEGLSEELEFQLRRVESL